MILLIELRYLDPSALPAGFLNIKNSEMINLFHDFLLPAYGNQSMLETSIINSWKDAVVVLVLDKLNKFWKRKEMKTPHLNKDYLKKIE